MIPGLQKEQEKEAFRLFEEGRYQESLQLCTAQAQGKPDSALEVLAATNLFYLSRLDDAESAFRDLARKMPDSSYVHSYLGKVLEARHDEDAVAEYARAVHLDPKNQEALRSYAEFHLARKDYYAAMPVLRSLTSLSKKAGDIQALMQAYIETGEAEEALALRTFSPGVTETTPEYIDALLQTGNYPLAAEFACRLYRQTKDPLILRTYLNALAQYDIPAALAAYTARIRKGIDNEILYDYALLLKRCGDYLRALEVAAALTSASREPVYLLLECELLSLTGQDSRALDTYERLVREVLAKNDTGAIGLVLPVYRRYLVDRFTVTPALDRFQRTVAGDINVVSLVETARFYEDAAKDPAETRSWYYRAYRADFMAGGLPYAQFLASRKDERECEKVMLYILANTRKSTDLARVAAIILDERFEMFRLKRLMDQLVKRLTEQQASLNSEGLEQLAVTFFIIASNALADADFAACKYYCLSGMDVMPSHTRAIQLEDYLRLLRIGKAGAVADLPVMHARRPRKTAPEPEPVHALAEKLGLSDQEQQIIVFLRSHRRATEADLRVLLGTRRVAGIMNRLMQKSSLQGIDLISKQGVGKDGEVYEYSGT